MEHDHPTSINLESPTFAGRGVIRSKTRGRTVSHRVSSLESQLEIAGKMSRRYCFQRYRRTGAGHDITSQSPISMCWISRLVGASFEMREIKAGPVVGLALSWGLLGKRGVTASIATSVNMTSMALYY
jgi:hypothetical protein